MKYLSLNECKYFPRNTIVKASPAIAFLAIVVVLSFIGGIPGFLLYKGEMPLWAFIAMQSLGLAFYLISIVTFLKTLKESN